MARVSGEWADAYRKKWSWDSVVWGSHSVDCYPGGCPFRVYVKDAEWRQVTVEHRELGPRGTLSGSFDLPDEPALGRWNIVVESGEGGAGGWGGRTFRVAA